MKLNQWMAMTVAFTVILAAASLGWTDLGSHPGASLENASGVAIGSTISSWLSGTPAEAGISR